MQDKQIYQALELAAANYPWDEVELAVKRQPEGRIQFVFYLPGNTKIGFEYAFGRGPTPEEAFEDLKKVAGDRNPEKARLAKIAELRMQIAKLESVQLTLPPYRAQGQLGYGDEPKAQPSRIDPAFINIETTVEKI